MAQLRVRSMLLFDLGAAAALLGVGIMFLDATIRRGLQLCREERFS
jgi:hypothetical protein